MEVDSIQQPWEPQLVPQPTVEMQPVVVVDNNMVPFGITIEGRPAILGLRALDVSKAVVEIPAPALVAELMFFLLPNSPVPPGTGAVLYYSIPPHTGWELLGAVDASCPSSILRTGWPEDEFGSTAPTAQLGVSIEPLDVIQNLRAAGAITARAGEDRRHFALQVAKDLYRFMTSFSQTHAANPEMMVIPTNILDRWIQRFESKYARDPNFVLRPQD